MELDKPNKRFFSLSLVNRYIGLSNEECIIEYVPESVGWEFVDYEFFMNLSKN